MDESIRSKYKNSDDYSHFLKVDEFGFIISSNENLEPTSSKTLINEWNEIIEKYLDKTNSFKKEIKKRNLLKTGIPPILRKKIWKILLSIKENQKNTLIHLLNKKSSKYSSSLSMHERFSKYPNYRYEDLKIKPSEYEYQIHVDIQRTFRKHYLFHNSFGKGQLELFNLLVAFANTYEEIGYCQGMSDIGAIFLIHFSESEAFEMMIRFFENNELTKIFDKNFTRLHQLLRIQNEFISVLIPDIFIHISKNLVSIQMSFLSWYLTFFSRFPIRLTLIIWDYMMFYGYKIVLYFVCAILHVNKKELITLEGEELVLFINKLQEKEIDENEVIDKIIIYLKEFSL